MLASFKPNCTKYANISQARTISPTANTLAYFGQRKVPTTVPPPGNDGGEKRKPKKIVAVEATSDTLDARNPY